MNISEAWFIHVLNLCNKPRNGRTDDSCQEDDEADEETVPIHHEESVRNG